MTETTATATTTTEHEAYDTDTFGVGEPCGVCIFPTGKGEICGNTVYANKSGGRLPKYCGQEGQAEWQSQHGTEGNARHRSDLAGYPRKQLGMTPEDVQTLAEAEAARRGITRRLKSESAPAAPVAELVTVPAPAAPADLAEALPESAVDALAELAVLITGRVVAARHEIDSVHEDFAKRVADIEADAARSAADLAAEREAVEAERTHLAELTEQAETAIREALDAKLRAEGQLSEARARIAELERAAVETAARHREEIETVREREEKRYDKLVESFAKTRGEVPAARPRKAAPVRPLDTDTVARFGERIERGDITVRADGVWLVVNAEATTATMRTIEHFNAAGWLVVGNGDPAPVSLSDEWAKRETK